MGDFHLSVILHQQKVVMVETVEMVDVRQRKAMEGKEVDHQLMKTVILGAVRCQEVKVEVKVFVHQTVVMVEELVDMADSNRTKMMAVKEVDHHLTTTVVLEAVWCQEVKVPAFVRLKAVMVEEED